MRKLSAIALFAFLVAVHPHAQTGVRASDPKIKTAVVTVTPTPKAGEAIIIDVYIQNLEQTDIRKNQFSPFSSSVGTPSISIVKVPQGDEVQLSPGLFTNAPDEWDNWYQPASGRDALQVGAFVLPARARVHLLHGDLRRMVRAAGEYCEQALANSTLLDKPDAAVTKKEYQNVVHFARQFAAGGEFDVSVWAYARSNTVRIKVDPQSPETPRVSILTRAAEPQLRNLHSLYQDDAFAFVGRHYGGGPRYPGPNTVPGLFVHSKANDHWIEITAISTEGGRFGRVSADMVVSVWWDYTPFAKVPYIDQPLMTPGSIMFPDRILYDSKTGRYELRHASSWSETHPGAVTILYIRRADLVAAFTARNPA